MSSSESNEENYQNIVLSRQQITILKRAQTSSLVNITADEEKSVRFLVNQGLLNVKRQYVDGKNHCSIDDVPTYNEYLLSDKGRMWLRYSQSDFWKEFRAWITLFIAAIGLVFSAISLAIDVYQLWVQ